MHCLSPIPVAQPSRSLNPEPVKKIRLIEVNAKSRHLKNIPVKGLCDECYRSIDWRFLAYIQSCWYFQPSFVICTLPCCPSPLLSGSTLPRFPVWKSILYTRKQHNVWGVGGMGLRQINTSRNVPLQVNLLNETFCIAFTSSFFTPLSSYISPFTWLRLTHTWLLFLCTATSLRLTDT